MITNSIQPWEYSRGSGSEGALYITDSDDYLTVFNVEHSDDDRWLNANNGNPDNFWNGNNRFVFARRNSLHFSPVFWAGEFCFTSWLCRPPSILPASVKGKESAVYFLLSSDFISHETWRNILGAYGKAWGLRQGLALTWRRVLLELWYESKYRFICWRVLSPLQQGCRETKDILRQKRLRAVFSIVIHLKQYRRDSSE